MKIQHIQQDFLPPLVKSYSKQHLDNPSQCQIHLKDYKINNIISTRVNLERRGVVVENSLCCLCGKEEKSYRHLFFICSFAWRVWSLCFEWLGVSFVSHNDPMSNFVQFRMNQSSDLVNDV